jgi:hypothetical protein
VALDSDNSAPKPDSAAGAAVAGITPTMTEPAVEVPCSQPQSSVATPEIMPEVVTTTATGAAMTGDDDGNSDELEVVTGFGGMSPFVRQWAWLILRYMKRMMCSSESGPILRKGSNASWSGVPCSRSTPPLRGRGQR